ncbi:MAG TPA: SusC/RagA family TonB-linked outer membrane protein [Puia sp.]|nr:SusC/RagA family TonB-linked outer membrane protein [Puia sp.]
MRRLLALLTVLTSISLSTLAQSKTVTGRITDQQNQPVPFATVKVKSAKGGTAADADGNFIIKAPVGSTIVISGAGITTKEIEVGSTNVLNIQVSRVQQELSTVVVTTAAGTKVNKVQQGFNSTTISAASLTEAKPTVLASALAGKAPGLQVMATGGGVNPTFRIMIRGQRSLTGNNQPLLILDGNIVTYDMLTNIDPEDVDNVNILNGPAAVALYGSQASNGALVITTKRATPGTQTIHVAQTVTAEDVAFEPKIQKDYGSGGSGYGTDTLGRPLYSPLENESFGPHFDGSKRPLGQPLQNGDQLYATYSYYKDRNKFWSTGLTNQSDMSFAGGDERSNIYVSGQYVTTTGTMPGDKFNRASFRLNGTRKIGNKVRVNYGMSYLQNRYNVAYDEGGVYNNFLNMPGEVPILMLKNWATNEYANPNGYYNPWYLSPFWYKDNYRSLTNNDYITGNLDVHFSPITGLDLVSTTGVTVRSQSYQQYENSFEYTPYAIAASGGSKTNVTGSDLQQSQYYNEVVQNFKAIFNRKFGNFSLNALGGMALQQDFQSNLSGGVAGLIQSGIYNLANTPGLTAASNSTYEARQVGFYYDVQLGWNDFLFLHTTGREDEVSVLAANNNKFFYPSVDVSLVLTKAISSLDNSKWLDMWKIRGSVSKVGQVNLGPGANPYGAYSLIPSIGQANGFPYRGAAGYQLATTFISPDLKPEITKSWEVGTDFKMFDGRVDGSLTYFDEHTNNQTLTTNIAWSTGFSNLLANAGETESKGYEAALRLTLLRNRNWNVNLASTYTYSDNRVLSIFPGLNNLSISAYGDGTGAYAVPGYQFPEIMGYDYMRQNGKVEVSAVTGMPIVNPQLVYLGNSNARNIVSFTPTVTFKSFSLAAVFEYRGGYKRYNSIGFNMDWSGMGIRTAEYNRQRFVFPNSVYQDGSGKWVNNTSVLISENGNGNGGFWTDVTENEAVTSNYISNGAFWKLRELSLTYNLSPKIAAATKVIKSASISAVGRNLLIWVPKTNLYTDPDYSDAGNSSNGIGLTGYQPPPSRFFGGNISINF